MDELPELRKRSRDCIDTVVYARINARKFVLNLVSTSYVMHLMTHQWEELYCGGVDNRSSAPVPDYCERLVDYWLYYDLLPAADTELVFSNKYDIGVLQSKPLRRPPPLPTDGSVFAKKIKN